MKDSKQTTRPQAKTAARKAFEREYGIKAPEENPVYQKMWEAFQLGWRLARGGKPTTREQP